VIARRVDGGLERRPALPPASVAEVSASKLEDVEDDVLKGRRLGARTVGAPRNEDRPQALEVMAHDSVRASPEGDELPVEDGLTGEQASELRIDVGKLSTVAFAVSGPTLDLATAREAVEETKAVPLRFEHPVFADGR